MVVLWLERKEHSARPFHAEKIDIARSAKDAAWAAAEAAREAAEAKKANVIATVAMIIAVIAIAVSVIQYLFETERKRWPHAVILCYSRSGRKADPGAGTCTWAVARRLLGSVSYEDIATLPISRALYEERGYEPPFDELPTKEEYDAAVGR